MLIEALHQWTFNEQVDASGETDDLEDEDDEEEESEDGFEAE